MFAARQPRLRLLRTTQRRAAGSTSDHVRRQVAANLTEVAAIPQVTTFRTVDCTELQAFREELGVSPLPVALAALCRTIPAHPLLNARWADDHLELRTTINVAIATDTERGLMIPVLQDAGARGIADLKAEVARLAGAARDGTLGTGGHPADRDDRVQQHRLLRLRGGHPAADAGLRGDARVRRDPAARPRG